MALLMLLVLLLGTDARPVALNTAKGWGVRVLLRLPVVAAKHTEVKILLSETNACLGALHLLGAVSGCLKKHALL